MAFYTDIFIAILPILVIGVLLQYYGVFNLVSSGGNLGVAAADGVFSFVKSGSSQIVKNIASSLPKAKYKGQSCSLHTDCYKHVPGKVGALACCKGNCTTMLKDWLGVGYCPDECRSGPFKPHGSCK